MIETGHLISCLTLRAFAEQKATFSKFANPPTLRWGACYEVLYLVVDSYGQDKII